MKRLMGKLIIFLSTIAFLSAALFLGKYFIEGEKSKSTIEEFQKTYVKRIERVAFEPNKFTGLSIDFAGLQAQNKDIIGWIDIPNTNISYPVVQGEDDEYYLHHTVKKEASAYGSIFLSSYNKDFTDAHCVIFGHNMTDGSMFAGLNDYGKIEHYKNASEIHIYVPEKIYVYKIFSAFQGDIKGESFALGSASNSELHGEQMLKIKQLSKYDTETQLNLKAPFISLITCNPWHDYGTRTTVHAVLQHVYAAK